MVWMQDEVLRGFARAHGLSGEVAQQLTFTVQLLLRELPSAARDELPILLARMLEAASHDERAALAIGEARSRKPNAGDTLAMDMPPVVARPFAVVTLDGTGRLERLLATMEGRAVEPRYEDLGFLGQGGMGEVRRVRDHDLGRTLAMKIIGDSIKDQVGAQAKFIEESRICAGLQHPGIVPVYELGRLPDGRFYFTMQEIEGHSLGVLIEQFHVAGAASGDAPGLRRLIDTFHRVCEAVAYAHARGVVHRDLKPDNVMLGGEGQVLVVDWGIAKSLGPIEAPGQNSEHDVALVAGGQRDETRLGGAAGTPAYMAPEQILGPSSLIDARTDVYSLGMILYEILAGAPPGAKDMDGLSLLRRAQAEVPPLGEILTEHALSATLVDICHRALRRDPAQRFQTAGALALAVGDWLEGVRQREHALTLVAEAAALDGEAQGLRIEALALRQQATTSLRQIPSWAAEEIKHPCWQQLHASDQLDRQATQRRLESEQRLYGALTFAPGLLEAHQSLALRYAAEHAEAEADKRADDAARAEFFLRTHCVMLPADSPVYMRMTAYLRAEGELSIATDPPNAVIHVHPFVLRDRRLHEAPAIGDSLAAPVDLALPVGSYLLRVEAPGRDTVLYPVAIARGQRWSATPPDGHGAVPVWLPPAGTIRPDEVYVPASWFRAGGDPAALNALPDCRLWLDGYAIRREPVSNREYLEFLNDLIDRGEAAEAARWVPIDLKALPPAPLYVRGTDGRYVCGDSVVVDWPVVYIDWPSARRFCRWLAARDGQPWRLPDELEWEKAARGVDGRLYPWGDWLDPSWCWTRDSHPQMPSLAVSAAHPVDRSPYGVLGMVGNSMDWCANPFVAPERFDASPRRVVPQVPPDEEDRSPTARLYRGGSWYYNAQLCRPVRRFRHPPDTRVNDLGLRPVRSLGPTFGGDVAAASPRASD